MVIIQIMMAQDMWLIFTRITRRFFIIIKIILKRLDYVNNTISRISPDFFADNSRALLITLTIYNPNIDQWMIYKHVKIIIDGKNSI